MNQYVTGTMIKRLRENKRMTQQQLAEEIGVSDKAISKWETGRGYPDISLIEPLAEALGVSIIELFSGEDVVNTNRSFNMQRIKYRKGFTMVEVLIVVAIIGVLSAVAFVGINQYDESVVCLGCGIFDRV